MQSNIMERYATLGQAVLDEEYDRLCKGLEYRTLKFNEKFDAAERKVSDAFQKQVDDLLTKLEEDKELARNTFQELDKATEENLKITKGYRHEIDDRKKYLEEIGSEVDARRRSNEQSQTTIDELTAKLQECQLDIDQSEKTSEDKLAAFEKAVASFQEGLCLVFKKMKDDYLMFLFGNIDSSNPDRKFTFRLKVLEDKRYQVTNCVPDVTELPGMVDKLNKTGDLATFTIAMRKKFQSLV